MRKLTGYETVADDNQREDCLFLYISIACHRCHQVGFSTKSGNITQVHQNLFQLRLQQGQIRRPAVESFGGRSRAQRRASSSPPSTRSRALPRFSSPTPRCWRPAGGKGGPGEPEPGLHGGFGRPGWSKMLSLFLYLKKAKGPLKSRCLSILGLQ